MTQPTTSRRGASLGWRLTFGASWAVLSAIRLVFLIARGNSWDVVMFAGSVVLMLAWLGSAYHASRQTRLRARRL